MFELMRIILINFDNSTYARQNWIRLGRFQAIKYIYILYLYIILLGVSEL